MNKTAGRPKGKNNKISMAFRFRSEMAQTIRALAQRNHLSQARVIEILVNRYGKEIKL